MTATGDVLHEVMEERVRQQDLHGWTPEHDDTHGRQEWAWLLARRITDLSCPWDSAVLDERRQLIEVAAIAVAAVESLDRRGLASREDEHDPT